MLSTVIIFDNIVQSIYVSFEYNAVYSIYTVYINNIQYSTIQYTIVHLPRSFSFLDRSNSFRSYSISARSVGSNCSAYFTT